MADSESAAIELTDVPPAQPEQEPPAGCPSEQGSGKAEHDDNYPHGWKLASLFLALFLAVLCIGLDRTIIATAIPYITDQFKSLDDVGWYGSAYLLTSCCFQLVFGKLYAEGNVKWIFLAALAIFEIGSVVCATAQSSVALIIGRAVAGLGSAGVINGAMIILAQVTPLHKRPKYLGSISASIGITQCAAPALGGVFTQHASWRWCFWINLPLGGVTVFVVFLLVNLPSKAHGKWNPRQFLQKCDILGTLVLMPSIVCLLLALQWGGSQYPWSNWRVVLLLCIFAATCLAWMFIQLRKGDEATVPPRIIKMRTMLCAMWLMFCMLGAQFPFVYYVPIWFQAVMNVSPTVSGRNFLATTVSQAIAAISAGFVTSKIGYYVPSMMMSTVLYSTASGLITRFSTNTAAGYWISSLILLGLGIGIGAQQPIVASQTVLSGADIALGTTALIFIQTLSGTIFLSVGENILQQGLVAELKVYAPSVNPSAILGMGAAGLRSNLSKLYPGDVVDGVILAYSKALRRVFLVSVVLASVSIFGAICCEWKSVKKNAKKGKKSPESGSDGK